MQALPKIPATVTVHVDVSSLIDDAALQKAAERITDAFRDAALAGINAALVQAGQEPLTPEDG